MTSPIVTPARRAPRRDAEHRRGRVGALIAATLAATLVTTLPMTAPTAHAEDPATPEPATTTTIPAPPPTTPVVTTPVTPVPTLPPFETVPPTAPPLPTPPAAAPRHITVIPSQIVDVLATIRYLESRGNYGAPPNKGNASGAYQFIASTWNNYGGYPHAYLAPPEVQDQRAAEDVTRFLKQWNNDVSMIPVMWYYPRAGREPALMDIVPMPGSGNVLTVREYQQRWLGVFASISGMQVPVAPTITPPAISRVGAPPELPATRPVDLNLPAKERNATVSFPVLGPTTIAAPDCGDASQAALTAGADATRSDIAAAGLCAEQAPGLIFGVKLQPIMSVVDGVVTEVVDRSGEPISVTVTDRTGRSYRLTGFNDDNPGTNDGAAPAHLRLTPLAHVGTVVRAGQILGFMGDTDPLPFGVRGEMATDNGVDPAHDGVAPHIRLTILDLDGTPVDAYGPVLDAVYRQVCVVGTGPWSSPMSGDSFEPLTVGTMNGQGGAASKWVITATGQVQASGWAALIYPSEACTSTPSETFGPDAGGTATVPATWWEPMALSTQVWIMLAARDRSDVPTVPIIRP